MGKKLYIYALLTTLLSMQSVKAENINIKPKQPQNNYFKEITLGESISFEEPSSTLIAIKDTEVMGEDASPLESSLEQQENRKPDEDKGFFNIFNLKGGVNKSDKEAATEGTLMHQWLNGNYATGKWFGARPLFEEHGVTINSSLLYSPFVKTSGGASGEGSGKGYSLFNLSVTVDTEKAGLWKGGTFYALYQRKAGYGISGANGCNGAMGDWMGLDGWDWRQINQISEYWYQQKLFENKLRLKVGKQDANGDFAFLNSGWDFMNTAFSVNPTIPMPTYPDQNFGFVAEINPKEWLSIRNGIYSKYGVPFNISEIEVKSKIKGKPGRYSIGAWEMSDSNGFEVPQSYNFNTGTTATNIYNRNYGAYAQFEQMVYKEKKDDENDMQGLVAFGQFGVSPSNRNDMSRYVGGGLHYTGLIPKRDKDRMGIAVASGNFAPRLGDITSMVGSETAFETFYRVQVTPWFYLQPDVQFIMRPSGYYDSSVAIGLRTVVTF